MYSHSSTFALLAFASTALARVQFLGVAIAGGDFGCQIDGSCPTGSAQLPLDNGPTQMQHFVKDDGMNLMRLPTSWQFLTNNVQGGDLDPTNFGQYDQLVQACLATGAHCMIDIHNFARWDGAIIGQGGPSDDEFARFWGQLAGRYAAEAKMVFELMNEPHDLDVAAWARTCQAAVTAIRRAGATRQMILLPGSNFDSAASLPDDATGGAAQLLAVTNPDGSTDNLLLDVHKYLDEDNSGTHELCTTDNVDAFTALAQFLRQNGRKGLVSETGASSDGSCLTNFKAQNTVINANADVFVGLVAWAAGSFDSSYVLSLTPTDDGQDNELLKQAVLGPWNAAAPARTTTIPSTTTKAKAPAPATAGTLTIPDYATSTFVTSLLTASGAAPATSPLLTASGSPTTTTSARASPTSKSGGGGADVLTVPSSLLQASSAAMSSTLWVATGTPAPHSGGAEVADSAAPTPTPTPTGSGKAGVSSDVAQGGATRGSRTDTWVAAAAAAMMMGAALVGL
ncbi:endoglucanase 2 [Xylariomycetidae sp. FL0641]|nr:endoglucanase 2 [Xylariomycetidae sp. FL0641]